MFKLERLKVVHRLAVGFGLVSTILAAVCVIGIWNSASVRHLIQNELAAAQLDYAQATDMLMLVQRQDVLMRNIGLSDDVEGMQRNASAAREARQRITLLFDSLLARSRSAQERDMMVQAREIDERSLPVSEKAIQLASAFQAEEAIKVINTKLEPLSSQRSVLLQRFVEAQKRKSDTVTETLVANASHALMLMLTSGVAGLLCAAASASLVARSISRPLGEAVVFANRLAEGDLTARIEAHSDDEIGSLVTALARMTERLCGVIGTLRGSAAEVLVASTEIASGNLDLSARTEVQAASLEVTASTLRTMVDAVRSNADSAMRANELATQASAVATVGGERVGEMAATMSDITASSKRIADIVSVIDGIAFQTNILALNAAVEAARAGDSGRGFAVVAGEVRNLSQRSAAAAKEIKALIAVNFEKVANGSRLVSDAGSTMAEICKSSRSVASIVSEISAVTSHQATGVQQVNQSIHEIDEMTQQNAALVEQVAAAAGSLERQTRTLNEAVNEFRTARPEGIPEAVPT